MESKTYLPLPIASAEYDQSSEQIFRNTAQINFQDVAGDINDLGLHSQKDASLSLRKFIFLGGCDTTPSVGMFHTLTIGGTTTIASILDEDDFASDSSTALATQQSIKAYIDGVSTSLSLEDLTDVTITSVTNNQVLSWDSSTTNWVNKDISVLGVSSVTAGNGLTGGGTGAVTLNVGAGEGISVDTTSVNLDIVGLTLTNNITPVTIDKTIDNLVFYHDNDSTHYRIQFDDVPITSFNNDAGYLTFAITTAGKGLENNAGQSSTINIDYAGTDNFILEATDALGVQISTSDRIAYVDFDDNVVKYGDVASLPFGDITDVIAGDGISVAQSSGPQPVVSLDIVDLTLTNNSTPVTIDKTIDNLVFYHDSDSTQYRIQFDDVPVSSFNNDAGYLTFAITTAGAGLENGGGTSTTISIDYAGTDNYILSATDLRGSAIASADMIAYVDFNDNNVKYGNVSDLPFLTTAVTQIVNGTNGGISVANATGPTTTLAIDISNLDLVLGSAVGTLDSLPFYDDGVGTKRVLFGNVPLSAFNNDLTLISAVNAGTGIAVTSAGTARTVAIEYGPSNIITSATEISPITVADGDWILVADTSDSLNLRKAQVSNWPYKGTVTSVTAGSGLTSTGSNAITLNVGEGAGILVNANDVSLDFSAGGLSSATAASGDFFAFYDVSAPGMRNSTANTIPLSIFLDDLGYTNVTASNGVKRVTNDIQVQYIGGTGSLIGAATDGTGEGTLQTTDRILFADDSNSFNVKYAQISQLPFTNNAGTVTSVAGTGTVSGITLSGTVTSSGSLTLGGTFSASAAAITAGTFGTGAYTFTRATADTTPTVRIENTSGTTGRVLLTLDGESDELRFENYDTGDWQIVNSQQTNGIRIKDGSGGITFLYNNAEVVAIDSSGGLDTLSGGILTGGTQRIQQDGDLVNIKDITTTGQVAVNASILDYSQVEIGGAFTSGGASTSASALRVSTDLTGAAGDTARLTLFEVGKGGSSIITQTATESIGVVATAFFGEPTITNNLTGNITEAATVYIEAAPTEGVSNYSLFIDSGDVRMQSVVYTGNLQPLSDGVYALGTTLNRWSTVYADSLDVGTFLAGDGAQSAPSYSFASDTNTGFYRPAADRFALTAGGSIYLSSELQSTYGYLKITEGAGGTVATLGTTSWSRTWYMGKNLRYNKTAATSSPYDRLNWEYIDGSTSSSQMGSLLISGSNGIAAWDFYAVPITTGAGVIPASFTRICRIATNGTDSTGGQIQMTDGAVTAPSYSFSSDSNTGMWLATANELAFSTDGAERMRIDSSGNVGIGTTSPGGKLHILGPTNATAIIEATANNDATLKLLEAGTGDVGAAFVYDGGDNKLYIQAGNNPPVTRMTIQRDDGRVGIGTTNPGRKFHVSASDSNIAAFSGANTGLVIQDNGSGANQVELVGYRQDDSTYNDILLRGASGGLFISSSNGYVGIGTTNPQNTLHVAGITTISDSSNPLLYFRDGSNVVEGGIGFSSVTDGLLRLAVGSTGLATDTKMVVKSNGNVGIGTTSPSLQSGGTGLEVVNNSYTQLRVESTTSSAGIEFKPGSGNLYEVQANNSSQWFVYDRTVGQYRLLINSSGNVGIGTTGPSGKLDVFDTVNGIAYTSFQNSSTGTSALSRLRIGNNGSANAFTIDAYGSNHSGKPNYVDIWNQFNAPLTLGSNGLERMRIDPAGDVGIGTTDPLKKLHVVGDMIVRDGSQGGVAAYSTAGNYHMHQISPRDAYYSTTAGTRFGVIYIRFPIETKTQVANTMMSMWVDMFDYNGGTDGESWSMQLGGYLSESNSGKWYNVFASTLTRRTDKANHRVRWATDTTNGYFYVLIGETSSTWNYPQIQVRDVNGGYNQADTTHWGGDWEVGFSTTVTQFTIWRDMYSETVATKLASGATAGGNFAVDENPTQIEDAATRTINWSLGNQQVVDLDSTTTTTININDTTMVPGGSYIIMLQKNAGGAQTVNWTSSANLLWVNGQTPVVGTATAGDITVVTFLYTEASTTKVVGAWYQTS